jgi:hypothetical protein
MMDDPTSGPVPVGVGEFSDGVPYTIWQSNEFACPTCGGELVSDGEPRLTSIEGQVQFFFRCAGCGARTGVWAWEEDGG